MNIFDLPSSSQVIKNMQFDSSARTRCINKLKFALNRYNIELLNKPKDARNEPELVKQ